MPSNAPQALEHCTGKKIIGFVRNAIQATGDLGRANTDTRTFIFEDGTGFTFTSGGAYWDESAGSIEKALISEHKRLEEAATDHARIGELRETIQKARNVVEA
jgi:hypothetical protein